MFVVLLWGRKCPFGHKMGCRCSPEAALLRLGNIWWADCSPVGEKCLFRHKMGCRCSPEAALLQLGNISGAECSAEVALPADWDTKKLPGFPGSFRYFLKYMLFIQFTIIADRNLHLKSFSHHHPLYKLFQLQGICP